MQLDPSTARATLPALSQHRWLRFATFTVFYIAQGFPIGLFSLAMPAWMLANGMSAGDVGTFVGISGLPWAMKLVVAPVMDRYQFLPMGRRRPWVVFAQIGVVASSLALLFVTDPSTDMLLLTVAATAINAFSATQDVAVDGMAIDILPAEEQGRANGFMMGGQVFGMSISGALSGTLLAAGGVALAGMALTIMVAFVSVLAFLFRERAGERLLPWSPGAATPRPDIPAQAGWGTIVLSLLRVLFVPMSLLLVLVELLFRTAGGIGLVMYPDIAVKALGYSAETFAQYLAATSAIAAVLGLAYGPLIDRFGADRMLAVALFAIALVFGSIGLSHAAWSAPYVAPAAMFAIDVVGQCVMVAMIALFMSACSPAVAASQFAVYMTTANLARSFGASAYDDIASHLAVHQVFFLSASLALVAALCMLAFDIRGMARHRDAAPPASPRPVFD